MKLQKTLTAALLLAAFAPLSAYADYVTGFETPFTTGPIAGQQGWTGSAFASGATAVNANIVSGAGTGGTQGLRITDFTGVADGTTTGAFTPLFTPVTGQTVSSIDVRIAGVTPGATTGGADYLLYFQSTVDNEVLAIVDFSYLGDINVLDDDGTGTNTLDFVDTGANWTPGSFLNLKVVSNAATNSLSYQVNGTTIYTSTSGLFGATSINQVVIASDNFQVAGETASFDNLSVTTAAPVPEPATMAALGLGAAALLRRRRKA